MKFFSNDAKENADEPALSRDHSDVATSDPVTVPQQRAGSPWSDTPGSTETAPSRPDEYPDGTRDGASDTTRDDEAGSPDGELADQERRDGTEEEPAARRDEFDTVTTYRPDGTVEERDAVSTDESAVRDEGTFDSPEAVEPTTGEPIAADESSAIKDEGTFDSPEAVEPTTGESLETDRSDKSDDTAEDRAEAETEAEEARAEARADEDKAEADLAGTPAPVVEGEPVAAAEAAEPEAALAAASSPGSAPATALDRLFTDGDSFAERFREIQLRFVDSPKEATADAAALVGEAVDKLTDALKAQKDSLGGDSEDTEQLRVQLRSYRDLLNRLSAL